MESISVEISPGAVVNRDIFWEITVKGNISIIFLVLLQDISVSHEENDVYIIDFCNIFHTVRAHH